MIRSVFIRGGLVFLPCLLVGVVTAEAKVRLQPRLSSFVFVLTDDLDVQAFQEQDVIDSFLVKFVNISASCPSRLTTLWGSTPTTPRSTATIFRWAGSTRYTPEVWKTRPSPPGCRRPDTVPRCSENTSTVIRRSARPLCSAGLVVLAQPQRRRSLSGVRLLAERERQEPKIRKRNSGLSG